MRLIEITRPDLDTIGHIITGPDLYVHHTMTEKQVQSIVAGGFSLKFFGATARKFRMHDLAAHDPKAIYATDAASYGRLDPTARPYVVFKVPGARVLAPTDKTNNFKEDLAKAYGMVGARLSSSLMRQGVDVVQNGLEYAVLDLSKIVITGSSLDTTA